MMKMKTAVCILAILTTLGAVSASAQKAPVNSEDQGWTGYSSFTESHDSSLGWSTILNSNVGYDFTRHFNMDVGVPVYLVQPYGTSSTSTGTSTQQSSSAYNSLGDVYVGMNYKAGGRLGYAGTLLLAAPTGSKVHGISTGRPTFDLNDHVEHDIWHLTPFLEGGFGNSNTALNIGNRNGNIHSIGLLGYATLGPMAHFQGGSSFDLGRGMSFNFSGYDMAPFGNQKVYSRVLSKNASAATAAAVAASAKGHGKGVYTVAAVTFGSSAIAVDRGIATGFDLNFGKRTDWGFEFTRSATNAVNTVAFSFGYRFGHIVPDDKK